MSVLCTGTYHVSYFTTNVTYHTEYILWYILATLATFVITILCLGTNLYKMDYR